MKKVIKIEILTMKWKDKKQQKQKLIVSERRTNNIGSKKVIMRNKVIRDKSISANCMVDKSIFQNKNIIKKVVGLIIIIIFSYTSHDRTC